MLKKFLRHIANPKELIYKLCSQYQASMRVTYEDRDYWKSIKNKYRGKRGFIICNGPSLSMSDLDRLVDEVTIASNKIYLAYENTKWRPTIYTTGDEILWSKIKNEINQYVSLVHIPSYIEKVDNAGTVYWKSRIMGLVRKFSRDVSKCVYSGHTITYQNLQIAVHLGLNPIYLIGCDHNYPGEKNVRAGVPIKQSEHQSHFVKSYRKKDEIVMPASIVDMEYSYNVAKKYAQKNGIEIYNATRGGYLEIFERVSFDDIV